MRDIPVGNGSLLINFDDKYHIRDVYFPHTGQENHSEGFPFRFGVWVDGIFSWLFNDDWQREIKYLPESAVTDVRLTNASLALRIECHDMVAARENVYLRRILTTDLSGNKREVRLFLHHDFRIYENKVGDTAFYDPETRSLIHYKKHRYFLINTLPHFDQFATGRKAFQEMQGTWRDAEDGVLSGGAITEGSVDSTIGVGLAVDANATVETFYWIAAGTSHDQVGELNSRVLADGPMVHFAHPPDQYEHRSQLDLESLPPEIVALYDRSLHIIRTQIDSDGAILAANDYDVTERATDNYSYVWQRDGSFVANALARAGFPKIAERFFLFCQRVLDEHGYFLQKYNADGTVGSGWHPYWDTRRKCPMTPIQEDETALVLWSLWEYHVIHNDEGFIRELYRHLISRSADFLADFCDNDTGLPLPSWNLWEDRRGVHTYTCATVVAGLRAAANFADIFGEQDRVAKYRSVADRIVAAMAERLYDHDLGRFIRGLLANGDDQLSPDPTIDSSLFGVFYFGCFKIDDSMVTTTMDAVARELTNPSPVGGVARFRNDGYMRENDHVVGNSWIICTLWVAEYYIARATSIDELEPALEHLRWVTRNAFPSGVLAEQIEPVTGRPLSVSPLTWSHSAFVATVLSYLERQSELKASAAGDQKTDDPDTKSEKS